MTQPVTEAEVCGNPCDGCPWRVANHGKRTPWGFFTKANMRRLWNEIRKAAGGAVAQSCHPTDPSHPDHVAAGAKPGSTPRECAGSIILVWRELRKLQQAATGETVGKEHVAAYLAENKRSGLTEAGLMHWLVGRMQLGGTVFGTGPKLPTVTVAQLDDPEVGRPDE